VSRGQDFASFNAAARYFLEADIGVVEDGDCAVDACEDTAIYRVPWPSMGGDVAYCGYHLARYRHQNPDLWERLQDVVDEELSRFATRGNRFLTFEDVPERLFGARFQAVALLVDGTALYIEVEPDVTGIVRAVDRSLETVHEREISVDALREFLAWVEEEIGVHTWASEYGGDGG